MHSNDNIILAEWYSSVGQLRQAVRMFTVAKLFEQPIDRISTSWSEPHLGNYLEKYPIRELASSEVSEILPPTLLLPLYTTSLYFRHATRQLPLKTG
jgi:hypothetical protein